MLHLLYIFVAKGLHSCTSTASTRLSCYYVLCNVFNVQITEPDVTPTADIVIIGVDVNEYVYVTYCRTNHEVDCENIAIFIFHISKATILHFIELANSVF